MLLTQRVRATKNPLPVSRRGLLPYTYCESFYRMIAFDIPSRIALIATSLEAFMNSACSAIRFSISCSSPRNGLDFQSSLSLSRSLCELFEDSVNRLFNRLKVVGIPVDSRAAVANSATFGLPLLLHSTP